ncbi:hypothetical protein Taro_027950 [Colocasia esculenta]|uniref:Uncharacterized protein n=1 Tax=Colocasia esculenta TaxID=4460 RepID=A0A843VLN2_COLES|nr:hypothetical protein [Colocasia esculenta]
MLKALAGDPFFFFFFLFPFLSSERDCLYPSRSGWIGSPWWFVDSIFCFYMLPSPMWCVYGVWVAPGWSIPRVCPSSGVATAVRVATPEGVVVSGRVGLTRWRRGLAVGCDLVATRFPIATGFLSRCPSPSR